MSYNKQRGIYLLSLICGEDLAPNGVSLGKCEMSLNRKARKIFLIYWKVIFPYLFTEVTANLDIVR